MEEGKKKREAKERLKALAETNGTMLDRKSDTAEDVFSGAGLNGIGLENGDVNEHLSDDQKISMQNGSVFFSFVDETIFFKIAFISTSILFVMQRE